MKNFDNSSANKVQELAEKIISECKRQEFKVHDFEHLQD